MRPFIAALVVAMLLFPASAALADTTGLIRGTVTVDGKPAAGVLVTLTGEGTTSRATTDSKGSFVFLRVVFGRYAVAAHRDGLPDATQDVQVQSGTVVNLTLPLGQLRQIGHAVTSSLRGVGATPVSANVIGREQIATLPDNESLNLLVETLPGIVRFSYNEPVAHGFHGLTYEIDGAPLPQATTANFSEILDPRDIDSLEVFTGAFPAEYGGSRQGAVVNIITRRANELSQPEEGSITAGLGSYGSSEGSLNEAIQAGKTTIFLDTNTERTDRGIDTPTIDPIHDNSSQSNEFLRTITNLNARDTLAFDFSNNFSQFQIPINTSLTSVDPVVNAPGTDDVQGEYSRFANVAFTINSLDGNSYTQIVPWYKLDRVAYLGDLPDDLKGYGPNPYASSPATLPLDGLRQDRSSTFEGLRVNHFHVIGKNAIKVGMDGSIENFHGTEEIAYFPLSASAVPASTPSYFFDNSAQRGTLFGAYAEDKWTPTNFFSVLGGLRFDHSTGYVGGSQLSPRLEVNGEVDPQDILHFYYGRLYSAPFVEDTRLAAIITAPAGTNASVPAYDLQPERDSYYEFGLAHTLTPNSQAYINFWKRNVYNVLDTTQIYPTPIFAVYNNTIGIAKGVEGRVESHWGNGDSLFFSTTLSQSLAGGISGGTFLFCPTPSTACRAGLLDVTLSPEDHNQTFEANLGYTKRLGTDRSYFVSFEPEYGTGYPVEFQNGFGTLPPHLTFDAGFGREDRHGKHPHLGYIVNVENLTNYQYLIKVNNGFNTTQWAQGRKVTLRVTQPF